MSTFSSSIQCGIPPASQAGGLEMTFLSDVVSVAFLRDLITWTTTDAVLSQLTSPAQGVYLCGECA